LEDMASYATDAYGVHGEHSQNAGLYLQFVYKERGRDTSH